MGRQRRITDSGLQLWLKKTSQKFGKAVLLNALKWTATFSCGIRRFALKTAVISATLNLCFCVQLAKKHFPKGEDNAMTIDVEKLRETLKQECYGAFFGGGFGGALVESFDLEGASPEELVAVALDKEIDLSKYQT